MVIYIYIYTSGHCVVTQLCLPVQLTPSPLNPVTHPQVKLPIVLLQAASASQLSDWSKHSSISTQNMEEKLRMSVGANGLCLN